MFGHRLGTAHGHRRVEQRAQRGRVGGRAGGRGLGRALELRQLPQPAEQALGTAPRQQQPAAALDPQRVGREQRQLLGAFARRHARQLVFATAGARAAVIAQRTQQAGRTGGRTHRGAELHQALVEIAGRLRRHQLAGQTPQRAHRRRGFDVALDGVQPRQHARDVAIDQGRRQRKRDRRDRAGRVGTDPGQRAQLLHRRRHPAAKALHHLLGAAVQIARPRVVAEPRPLRQDVVERRLGQRRDGGKARQPAFEIRDHGRHPGLLQHDLGDPDRVGIAAAAPRQVALGAAEISDHAFGERGRRRGRGGRRRIGARRTRATHARTLPLPAAARDPPRRAFRASSDARTNPGSIAETPIKSDLTGIHVSR
ncbi:hypothetical protein Hoch_6561 [Haliangium ochraceum DSM 14365]|uniref:Uncharacterized protein n=1 Tax=Haliangium ochraceum (strain DSM 14365 / JCM 11303 / SMP-2) TaxID=502025 RepID=D0LRN7_HALO1|nr:hypothetical protein Hoch_6561 [Haliangium ochraceum DSM 14365]